MNVRSSVLLSRQLQGFSTLFWSILLAVVVASGPWKATGQQAVVKKLTLSQVTDLISHGVPDSTMSTEIQRRGLAFTPTPAIFDELRGKGAGPLTLAAIQALAPASSTSMLHSLSASRNANESSSSGVWTQASGLQQCVRLILQVEVKEAVGAETDNTIARLQRDLKTSNIGFSQVFKPDWSGRPELVEVDGVAPNTFSLLRALLNQKYSNEFDIDSTGEGALKLTMKPLVQKALDEKTLQQAIETIRRRMDVFGVRVLLIQEYNPGSNQILVELSGVSNLDHVKNIIQSTVRLGIHAVKSDPSGYPDDQSALAAIGGVLPPDEEIVHGSGRVFILQRVAIVAGSDFRSAELLVSPTGHPIVNLTLTHEAAARYSDFTTANIGKSVAAVIGGRIREFGVISDAYRCCDVGIDGAFTLQEAADLSRLLRTSELPASVDFLEDRVGCQSSSSIPGPTR